MPPRKKDGRGNLAAVQNGLVGGNKHPKKSKRQIARACIGREKKERNRTELKSIPHNVSKTEVQEGERVISGCRRKGRRQDLRHASGPKRLSERKQE